MNNITNNINEYMDNYTRVFPFSGSVVVVKDGEELLTKHYGMACVEHQVAINRNTAFKIASLTKHITCVGILKLMELGLLDIHESIGSIFPDYPELDERITPHHLMSNTSGLHSNFSDVDPHLYLGKRLFSHEEVFEVFKDMPLEFEPGEGWSYCYFGYYLLGVIIERISGKSYIDFLTEYIFKPLGMKNTVLDDYIKIVPNRAYGYYTSEGGLVSCDIDTMSVFSAGALVSTIDDLLLWDRELYSQTLLSKESYKAMFTSYRDDYGYGFVVDSMLDKKRVRHSGGGSGFSHQYHRYMDENISIIVLSNHGFTNSFDINETIAKILFQAEYDMPVKPKEVEMSIEDLERYTGIYGSGLPRFEIKMLEDKLICIEEKKWIMPIYPIGENKFHHEWIDEEVEFGVDAEGCLSLFGCAKIQV